MGKVEAVCISLKKGTPKQDIGECLIIEGYGLEKDAHAGSERQVSLLSWEDVKTFEDSVNEGKPEDERMHLEPGAFGENLLISGIDLAKQEIGARLIVRDVVLEITQIGKTCHSGCTITQVTGKCIMPKKGVFAKVVRGGIIMKGDRIETETGTEIETDTETRTKTETVIEIEAESEAGKKMEVEKETKAEKRTGLGTETETDGPAGGNKIVATVITSSDRAYQGVYEDKSGPALADILKNEGYKIAETLILPDEEAMMYQKLTEIADAGGVDVVFTTGGTGFSERDRVPEATSRACDRMAPGISEAIRSYSMQFTDKAMLSRGVSGIRKKTLIINLPGSPKAVKESLEAILPALEHGIRIMRGEADG